MFSFQQIVLSFQQIYFRVGNFHWNSKSIFYCCSFQWTQLGSYSWKITSRYLRGLGWIWSQLLKIDKLSFWLHSVPNLTLTLSPLFFLLDFVPFSLSDFVLFSLSNFVLFFLIDLALFFATNYLFVSSWGFTLIIQSPLIIFWFSFFFCPLRHDLNQVCCYFSLVFAHTRHFFSWFSVKDRYVLRNNSLLLLMMIRSCDLYCWYSCYWMIALPFADSPFPVAAYWILQMGGSSGSQFLCTSLDHKRSLFGITLTNSDGREDKFGALKAFDSLRPFLSIIFTLFL